MELCGTAEMAPKGAKVDSDGGGAIGEGVIEEKVDKAVRVIQKAWKNYSKKVISFDLYDQAKEVMAVPGWKDTLLQAEYGNTYVGLPQGLDVVIKQSFITRHGDRKVEMHQAHDVCEMLNLQTMLVPKVRRFGDFLIEDRVKFDKCDYGVQTKLYIENTSAFTQTAIDFVRFLMYSYTFDLVTVKGMFSEHDMALPRYDNAVLYLREVDGLPVGMMALVDIERFSKGFLDFSTKATVQDVATALRFFPLHSEEIIATALGEFSYLVKHEPEIRRKAEEALETQKAFL